LDREGDLVQHIGGLMDPTPLMPGAGKDLLDRFPEAERPVADREVRGDLETTLVTASSAGGGRPSSAIRREAAD
jgi:hypothetical protein